MVGTSSSSSSSCASFGSFDDVSVKNSSSTVKFLCSYGGKILPRYPDGKLRYVGGETRVLAVDRSVPFSELQVKLGELSGWGVVSLRCQLPSEDLDALVSITSDEDLANLIEEYDLAGGREKLKIRAFLHPPPSKPQKLSPITKAKSSARPPVPLPVADRCVHHQISVPARLSGRSAAGDHHHHHHHRFHGAPGSYRHQQHLVHHGNYWQ